MESNSIEVLYWVVDFKEKYSGAHLIHTANVRKICANYPSMQMIKAYVTLHFY